MRNFILGVRPGVAACLLLATHLAHGQGAVAYTYDDAGRVKSATFPGNIAVHYSYDAAGNRTVVWSGPAVQLSLQGPASNPTEGSALLFRVTKTGTSAQAISVTCHPIDGTASSTGAAPLNDYVTTPQTVNFPSSDPSGTVRTCSIASNQDTYYEGNETVLVGLRDPSVGGVVSVANASGTIVDNDTAPSLAISGQALAEGQAVTFTITRTGQSQLTHDVNYATSNGTATTADSDYTAKSAVASVPASQSSVPVTVNTGSDTKYESNETFAVTLSSPTNGATLGTPSANGTINNDDSAPTFAINDPAQVLEGNSITFTITRSGSTGLTHSFNWATGNNTAVAPGDYTSASGSVNFAVPDVTQTVQVQTAADAVNGEGIETFYVNLTTNASTNGGVLSDAQGLGTINDPSSAAPSVPGNLRTNEAGTTTDGNYQVLWDASTGSPTQYILEEATNPAFSPLQSPSPYTINAPTTFKSISRSGNGVEFYYRVKACNAAAQCSAFSTPTSILVCFPGQCP